MDSLYLPILLSSIPLLIKTTESLDAELVNETLDDKYPEYISDERAKLFDGVEKISIKQNRVAQIENRQ